MGKDLKGKDLGKGFGQRKDGRYEARCMVNGQKLCLYGTNLTQLRKDFEKAKISSTCNQTGNYAAMLLKDWFEEWFVEYKIPRLKNKESAKFLGHETCTSSVQVFAIVKTVVLSLD